MGAEEQPGDQIDRLQAELDECLRQLEGYQRVDSEHAVILDSLAASVVVQDLDGFIRYANPAAARTLGCSAPEELIGTTTAELFKRFDLLAESGGTIRHEDAPGQRALRGEPEPEAIIGYRIPETGDERWAMVRARPIRDAAGQPSAIVSVYEDITTQKRAEQLLAERERRFRALIEHSVDAIILLESDGHIRYASRAAAQMVGYTVASLGTQSQHISAWIHPDDALAVMGAIAAIQVTPDESSKEIRFRVRHHDGGWRWMEGMVSNLLDEPSVRALVGNYHDITDRLAAEERLSVLAEAGSILSSSLDYQTTLRHVADLAARELADWVGIEIVDEGGVPHSLVTAHRDPERLVLAETLRQRYPTDPDAPGGINEVLRSGEPVLLPEISEELLVAGARDPEHLALLREIGFHSMMIVPLVARGRVLGALTLVASTPERRYTEADLSLAGALAERAATAIDNARLYQESSVARERAERLSDIAHVFAEESLDLPALLQTVAQEAAQLLGNGCVIRLRDEELGQLIIVGSYHENPEAHALIRELVAFAPRSASSGIQGEVIETQEVALIHSIDPVRFPHIAPYIDRFGMQSMLIAPLRVRGRVLGTIVLWRDGSSLPHTEDERTLLKDLADRAALAIDNAQLYQQVQHALQHRTEFLSIASHELKTPLTSLKGYIQLLQRTLERSPNDHARMVRTTQSLQEQASRFEGLVADLLDASRIQQGRLDLQIEPVDLGSLADQVLARFEHVAEQSGHRLVLDAPEVIIGAWDRDRLDQVLSNLVSNAIKYSPGGGAVRLQVRVVGREAEVSVRDQGLGIADEEQANLFQPFVRGAAGGLLGGTGLGLYISRTIVEQHGGVIRLESRPGQGSCFVVRLPLIQAESV